MKRKIKLFFLLGLLVFPTEAYAKNSLIDVYLDEMPYHLEYDAAILGDRLHLAIRDLSEITGSKVTWIEESKTAVFSNNGQDIYFSLGEKKVIISQGKEVVIKEMDVVPAIINDRMYIPARFASEFSGLKVVWDNENRGVYISSNSAEVNEDAKKIVVGELVRYSYEENRLDDIVYYIQRNLDENFDVDLFEVNKGLSNVIVNDEIISTAIKMSLKNNGYVTENSYYIVIENDLVKYIYINGDPSCLGIEKNDEVDLDEKMLKNLALEKIEIPEGYQVKRQKVKKIYDEKPYYRVITYLENDYGFSVSKIFEYRLE